eukprot:gene542-8054_t
MKLLNKLKKPTLEEFREKFFKKEIPCLITDSISTWKALKSWKNAEYLIENTTNKKIPIETSSYTNFETKLISFQNYIQDKSSGYLAQYPLFEDFENLKNDFEIPKYCKAGLGDIYMINAWIGPKNTISNLHYDPNPNLFCQIKGKKKIRIYDKKDSKFMYPHKHFRLKNTSQVNLDEEVDAEKFPGFDSLEYWEFEINEGEMLFIPCKFWHHVKSLEERTTKEKLSKHYIKNYKPFKFNVKQIEKFYYKYIKVRVLKDIFQEDDTNEIKFNLSFVVTTNSKRKTIITIDYSHLLKILLNLKTKFLLITLTLSFINDGQSITFGKINCKDAFYLTALLKERNKDFRWKVCAYGINGMSMY